ncbi:MAG: hypothetical protein Q8R35_02260 [bacterium]|nr:hypothetical protein [bacterium]
MKFFKQYFFHQPRSLWFSIAVLAVIAAAVWYYSVPRPHAPVADGRSAVIDAAASQLRVQGDSDDVEAIGADLKATDLQGLDSELDDIDAELGR